MSMHLIKNLWRPRTINRGDFGPRSRARNRHRGATSVTRWQGFQLSFSRHGPLSNEATTVRALPARHGLEPYMVEVSGALMRLRPSRPGRRTSRISWIFLGQAAMMVREHGQEFRMRTGIMVRPVRCFCSCHRPCARPSRSPAYSSSRGGRRNYANQ